MRHIDGDRIAELCDELIEQTEAGDGDFDLENADLEELKDQMVAMLDAVENLVMIAHRALQELSLSKRQGAQA